MSAAPRARRSSRDRHGRGPRGPLATRDIPLLRSRGEVFLDTVEDAIDHLAGRWSAQLDSIEFSVADVPDPEHQGTEELADPSGVPLARVWRESESRSKVVLYRRPLELRAADQGELAEIVHDVVVEAVARVLELDPDTIDPGFAD
ncbi:MAG: metallopeptidase family protein [Mycobacteriales bacterium]